MLVHAERLHKQIFRPGPSFGLGLSWEPPIDILETDIDVLVLVALPGVNPDNVEAVIDHEDLLVTGTRLLRCLRCSIRSKTTHFGITISRFRSISVESSS